MFEVQLKRLAASIAPSVVLVGVMALAGCSSPEASNLPTPAAVWGDGEPTGPEWNSEWATAYKEAVIQLSAARAYGDFSDPDLIAALGYDEAQVKAMTSAEDRFEQNSSEYSFYELDGTFAFWGGVVEVDESADGTSATVYACEPSIRGGTELVPAVDTAVVTRTAGGGLNVDSNAHEGVHPNNCADATIWVAKWAEPIDIDNVGRDTVKMPLPREYYVKLGVISE